MVKAFVSDVKSLTWNIRPYIQLVPRDKAEVLILWQDIIGAEKVWAEEALRKGIPVVVIQHGRRASSDYSFNGFPLLADRFCCWGKADYNRMKQAGYGDDRIKIVGCPALEGIKPADISKNRTVCFIPVKWAYEIEENYLVMEELIKSGYNILVKIVALPIYIKLQQVYGRHPKVRFLITQPASRDHFPILIENLKRCGVVVSIAEQQETTQLIAEALGIPVVTVSDVWTKKDIGSGWIDLDPHYENENKRVPDEVPSSYYTKLKKLSARINQVMFRDYKQDDRREVAKIEGGLGMPVTENLMSVIKGVV